MNNDLLRHKAPAIFADAPKNVSHRYSFIPTSRMVDDLSSMNWMPSNALATRGNDHGFHVVRFRERDSVAVLDGCHPEIVLSNSHNGTSSFRLLAGIFRLVCANGLVIADGMFGAIQIRHVNYSYQAVKLAVNDFASRLPSAIEQVEKFSTVYLNRTARLDFAVKAVKLRWPDKTPEVNYERILEPRRHQDTSTSVWHTMNLLQEKIVGGKIRDNKFHKMRPIKTAKADIEFNTAMFELAQSYTN